MRITRIRGKKRRQILRIGLLGMSMSCLWGHRSNLLEWWQKLSYAVTYFCMGVFEVFAGLSGLYIEDVVPRLGYWHVCFDAWLEEVLGVEKDTDLSRRIVDPRHRMSALEAIEDARSKAWRRKGNGTHER